MEKTQRKNLNPVDLMGNFVCKLSHLETDIAVRKDVPVWLNYSVT